MHNFDLVSRPSRALMRHAQAVGRWQVTHAG
ncbi:hypothetical protein CF132_00720 [Aeromonas dhakensis]|nr:hypothetical protein CK627_17930 [Aeromonas dhakensis]TND50554.1 hypothetical protein CF129_22195 [Aeromonas dhakensis]TNI23340.1 hypothetical protein CF132_00720 [Aeromonas dhakensis]TNI28773.1 hypothetical protein CF131_18795 [Aeromonas dhakensis]TNI46080.1 hypothetical protein CF130_07960 [Aeromonas dhakensis]